MSLSVAGFAADSIVDGPGLRFAVFFQGCPHHCPGCHNPETWPFEGGVKLTPGEIIRQAKKSPLCKGITLSGGEPFAQANEEMLELVKLARQEGYEVASYTGYTFEHLLKEGTSGQKALLESLDTLIDGPFLQQEMSLELRFRGSRNQRILDVKKSLAAGQPVWEAKRWTGEIQ